MIPARKKSASDTSGFSLVEMVVVMAVIAILTTAGIALLRDNGPHARKTATDQVSGLVEQARNLAITSRCHAIVAVAEPGDLPSGDTVCRIGLFKVDEWPADPAAPVAATLVKRWSTLEKGIVLLDGGVESLPNMIGGEELTLSYRGNTVKVHALVFQPRGGLKFPEGSSPVAIRIAEGAYRNGSRMAKRSAGQDGVPENILRVGRSLARPYRVK